jgi:hypothetical protein
MCVGWSFNQAIRTRQGKPRWKGSYEVVHGLRHRTARLGEEGEGEEVELGSQPLCAPSQPLCVPVCLSCVPSQPSRTVNPVLYLLETGKAGCAKLNLLHCNAAPWSLLEALAGKTRLPFTRPLQIRGKKNE